MAIPLRNTLFHLALALTAGAFLSAAPFDSNARDFRSTDVHPGDYPTVAAVQYMGKLVSEQTKGRMGVRVYPSGSLGTEKDNIEQLKIGGLDMMRINAAVLNNIVPETMVVSMPFL